jgi:hypothetical protein
MHNLHLTNWLVQCVRQIYADEPSWHDICSASQKEKMMMKYFMPAVLGLTLISSPAFAAKTAHHCVDKNKQEITLTAAPGKTLAAQCKAAGGKWVKMKTTTTTTTTTTAK